jgi:hypothetical protein
MCKVDACRGGHSSPGMSLAEEHALSEPSSTVRAKGGEDAPRGADPAWSSPEQRPPKSFLLVIGVMT